ncbi:hypothetical protein AB5I83_17810 [Mesobacillus sp. LC4]
MSQFINRLSKSPNLLVGGSLASLISLPVSLVLSYLNENLFMWSLLTINIFILILLFILVKQNSRVLGRLDQVDYYIFNKNIDLEFDENLDKYVSKSDIILVLNSSLTTETIASKPFVEIQLSYPPQLQIDYNWTSEQILREEAKSDSSKFKISLVSGVVIIALRSLCLEKDQEKAFSETSGKIQIAIESELLSESRKEVIPVSIF